MGCTHVVAVCVLAGVALPGLPRAEENPRALAAEPEAPAAAPAATYALARHWAPSFYHDTDSSHYVGDYITHFNFDGDYNGKNNWENLEGKQTVPAYVYFAVSETTTHYFLNYSVFHPHDWHEWLAADRHENDLEGVSLVIQKDGGFGRLVAMETLAHDSFSQYAMAPGIESGIEDIDGGISLDGASHPRVFIEAKGHGMYGCDDRCDSAPDGDGIVYVAADRAESPQGGDGNYSRRYGYALIAMDADGSVDGNQGLWHRRNDICDTCTFGAWGKFRGDNYGENRANAPWNWRSVDRGPVRQGDMLCDPAFFFDAHLNGSAFDGEFSHTYLSHAFRTHALPVQGRLKPSAGSWLAFSEGTSYRPQAVRFGEAPGEHSLCRPGTLSTPAASGPAIAQRSTHR